MESNLRNSYLMGADFENASLYKADLRGAKGLTIEQLAKAKTLYLALFDDELLEQIKSSIPELVGAWIILYSENINYFCNNNGRTQCVAVVFFFKW